MSCALMDEAARNELIRQLPSGLINTNEFIRKISADRTLDVLLTLQSSFVIQTWCWSRPFPPLALWQATNYTAVCCAATLVYQTGVRWGGWGGSKFAKSFFDDSVIMCCSLLATIQQLTTLPSYLRGFRWILMTYVAPNPRNTRPSNRRLIGVFSVLHTHNIRSKAWCAVWEVGPKCDNDSSHSQN